MASWLLTLVHHRAVDLVRRETALKQRLAPVSVAELERALPPAVPAEQSVVDAEVREQVRAALRQLPPSQQHVLLLCHFAGCSHSETAAALGGAVGHGEIALLSGDPRLRDRLAQLGDHDR